MGEVYAKPTKEYYEKTLTSEKSFKDQKDLKDNETVKVAFEIDDISKYLRDELNPIITSIAKLDKRMVEIEKKLG